MNKDNTLITQKEIDFYLKKGYTFKLHSYGVKLSDCVYLTYINLTTSFNTFWEDVVLKLPDGDTLNIMFKAYVDNFNGFRTIGYMKRNIYKSQKSEILNYFINFWELKSDDYLKSFVSEIKFEYRVIPAKLSINIKQNERESKKLTIKELDTFKLGGNKLINSMDPEKWGSIEKINEDGSIEVLSPNKRLKYIFIKDIKNPERLQIILKSGGDVLMTIYDTKLDDTTFKREYGKHELTIKDGKIIFNILERKFAYISQIKCDSWPDKSFITMDLETMVIEGKHVPYCICVYDGFNVSSYYLTDYLNNENMLNKCLDDLLIRKNKGKKVYLHNFSNFDSMFLINILHKRSDIPLKPNRREGRLIELKFYYHESKYLITFRDSLLMLPSSLRSLTKAFNVEVEKGNFPHKIFNRGIGLDYKGDFPLIDDYYDLKPSEYDEIKEIFSKDSLGKVWDLKEESIKYCGIDVISLYQVIQKFSESIYELYKINVHKYPTISSLAFGIYRANFLNKDVNIPIITGLTFNFMKNGYTGGSVDVFKPYGKDIFRYDVSSLYPYVMKTCKVPVGRVRYFEGDPRNIMNNPYGVFEVEVKTPSDIRIPILQKRFKLKTQLSTMSPLGEWKGVYFSEELYNAEKYGYQFKILRGYLFESAIIFDKYVESLYDLKQKAEKGTPNYIISKMLMNSLYGRFGMTDEFEQHIILPKKESLIYELNSEITVTDVTELDGGKVWLSFHNNSNKNETDDQITKSVNISIPIALAVTAFGRIYMSKFKNRPDLDIYYTDTDSIDVDKELEPEVVGNSIGDMVLEYKFKECMYIAPKVYAGTIYPNIGVKGKKEDSSIIKIKGFKDTSNIKLDDIKPLLNNDKLVLSQEKFFKNYVEGTIEVRNQLYSLMVTSNKRKLIRDSTNKIVDTAPYSLKYNSKYNPETNDSCGYDIS